MTCSSVSRMLMSFHGRLPPLSASLRAGTQQRCSSRLLERQLAPSPPFDRASVQACACSAFTCRFSAQDGRLRAAFSSSRSLIVGGGLRRRGPARCVRPSCRLLLPVLVRRCSLSPQPGRGAKIVRERLHRPLISIEMTMSRPIRRSSRSDRPLVAYIGDRQTGHRPRLHRVQRLLDHRHHAGPKPAMGLRQCGLTACAPFLGTAAPIFSSIDLSAARAQSRNSLSFMACPFARHAWRDGWRRR